MKGKITIDGKLCKGCGFCITACPKGLIVLSENFNAMGYYPAQPSDSDGCNGCGLCAVMCPDIAIEVWRESKE
ncbi:MAG: ferredoxin family protein [Nitrospirae bacterium]|nr:ferredoxin family protein [Nitrospirota bacterium]